MAASVDGELVLRRDLEDALARTAGGRRLGEKERARRLRVLLDRRVEAILVEARLRAEGITADAEEVEARIAARRAAHGGDEGLRRSLDATGLSLEDLRREEARESGLEQFLDRERPLRLDDAAVLRIARERHGAPTPRLEARFALILRRLPPDAGPDAEGPPRRLLDRVLALLQGGMSFEEAAEAYSEDTSRVSGGQYDFSATSALDPRLRDAVLASPIGTVTGPLRTGDGMLLLRVDGLRAELQPDESARVAQVRGQLLAAQRSERRTDYLQELRAAATVEIAEDLR
ncbi:MAG: peptidylprolyl isomerase [Deltaproteobacteria bacterium]|nr:peptidylprolyl isomerase [Deltaproteobacteria bacterium]